MVLEGIREEARHDDESVEQASGVSMDANQLRLFTVLPSGNGKKDEAPSLA